MNTHPERPTVHWPRRIIAAAAVIAVYVWTLQGLEISVARVLRGIDGAWRLIRLMVPNWAYWPSVWQGIVESLQIAIIGTTAASLAAVPFGFWAASGGGDGGGDTRLGGRVAAGLRSFIRTGAGKTGLNVIRTFPELLLAIVFIRAVGLGPFAGVLAVGGHSIGTLGKLYAEAVETIDREPIEALRAAGANPLQVAWYAILPQVLPNFASLALYRFEINVRAATVLGIVGAGGIGKPLIFNIQLRNWDNVGMIMLGVILLVMIIDTISGSLRARLV